MRRRIPRWVWLLALTTFLTAGPGWAQECLEYADYLHWIGSTDVPLAAAYGVGLAANHLCVADYGHGVKVYDVSSPGRPRLVSTVSTPGAARGLATRGNFAYVADGASGIQAIDLSDPLAPVVRQVSLPGAYVSEIRIDGPFAYAIYQQSFSIFDVSVPGGLPYHRGRVMTGGTPNDVAIYSHYAYVSLDDDGVGVFDITWPSSSVRVGTLPVGGPGALGVRGRYLYVTDAATGLRVYDLANPVQPSFAYSMTAPIGIGARMVFHENLAFITGYVDETRIVDITNPTFPQIVQTLNMRGVPLDVAASGTTLYVAANGGGLQIFSFASLAQVPVVGFVDTPGTAVAVGVQGNYGYVADGTGGLQYLDLSNPAAPTRRYGVGVPGGATNLAVDAPYVYVSAANRFDVFVIEPDFGLRIATINVSGWISEIAVAGGVACIGEANPGLETVDISDPHHPAILGRCDLGCVNSVAVSGNIAYAAVRGEGLRVVDISSPRTPVVVGALDLANYYDGQLTVAGDWLYLAGWAAGIFVVDISDPQAPRLVRVAPVPGSAAEPTVDGDRLYVADRMCGIQVFDILDRGDPVAIGSLPIRDYGHGVTVDRGYVYVPAGAAGVKVVRAQCPVPPIELTIDVKPGSEDNPIQCRGGSRAVVPVAILTTAAFDALRVDHASVRFGPGGAAEAHAAHGPTRHEEDVDGDGDIDLLFHFRLEDAQFGCEDVKASLTGVTFDGRQVVGADRIRMLSPHDKQALSDLSLNVEPNPANPRTTVSFRLDGPATVRVDVFDVKGNRVARLASGEFAAGAHALAWNGLDDDGRVLPSGNYFLRAACAGQVDVRKITLLK